MKLLKLIGLHQSFFTIVDNFFFVPEYGLPAAAWTRFTARLFLLFFTVLAGWLTFRKQYAKKLV
jgi:hypothetical protein